MHSVCVCAGVLCTVEMKSWSLAGWCSAVVASSTVPLPLMPSLISCARSLTPSPSRYCVLSFLSFQFDAESFSKCHLILFHCHHDSHRNSYFSFTILSCNIKMIWTNKAWKPTMGQHFSLFTVHWSHNAYTYKIWRGKRQMYLNLYEEEVCIKAMWPLKSNQLFKIQLKWQV